MSITLVLVVASFLGIPLWIIIAVIVPLAYWYGTRNHDYWTKKGLLGPKMTPFLGNLFSITTPLPLLHEKYAKQFGKLFGLYQGQTPVLMVCDPDIIKRILVKDFHLFRNRVPIPGGIKHKIISSNLVVARSEQWRRIRSILTPMFTCAKIRQMETLMEDCVQSMLCSFEEASQTGDTFEAHGPMGRFTMDVIAKCAFATDPSKEPSFVVNAKGALNFSMFRMLLLFLLPQRLLQFLSDHKVAPVYQHELDFFFNLSGHLIKQRKAEANADKYHDMLQLMVLAEHSAETLQNAYKEDLRAADLAQHLNSGDGEELEQKQREMRDIIGSKYLSEEEIIAQALVIYIAGYETTAATLTFCLYELAINPTVQQRLFEAIQLLKEEDSTLSYATLCKCDYLDAVLAETLRKYPPAMLINRESSEPYRIAEHQLSLEAKQSVMIPVYAIHHTEEFFPQPDKFDPERFMPANRLKIVPYSYLPFGAGPRNCIGMRFALTEAKMGLAKILDQFQIVRVPETTDRLQIKACFFTLKTSPVKIGARRRR